jgi:hypothetical protein
MNIAINKQIQYFEFTRHSKYDGLTVSLERVYRLKINPPLSAYISTPLFCKHRRYRWEGEESDHFPTTLRESIVRSSNGYNRFTRRTACRNRSISATSKSRFRSSRATVKKYVPPVIYALWVQSSADSPASLLPPARPFLAEVEFA